MSRDDIIKLAQEAGITMVLPAPYGQVEALECFANLVAAAEREACAKVADVEHAACWHATALQPAKAATRIAAAIRARGNA